MLTPSVPHIAIYLRTLYNGGIECSMINLMNSLVKQGLRVDLVLDYYGYSPFRALIPPEVRLVTLGAEKTWHRLPKLMGYLGRERPTAVITANDFANQLAVLARRLTGVPTKVLLTVRTHLSTDIAAKTRRSVALIPWSAKLLYPWADAIVTVSRGVGDDLAQLTGIDRQRIHTVYNPVITPAMTEQALAPVEHPWFNDREIPVIVGVGRLEAQKDFDLLIRAFAQVRQVRPARLVILGNGSLRPALTAQIAALGLEADVDLPGFVNNAYAYLAKAAVFALSSAWEGLGLVVIEALAVGTPVVATDCPSGPAEILDGGRYGELVPVGDSEAMATAILQVLAGRTKATDAAWLHQFTVDYSASRYLELLGLNYPVAAPAALPITTLPNLT